VVEQLRPRWLAPQRRVAGAQPALNRAQAHAERLRNRRHRPALRVQPRDLLVAGLPLFKPFARPLDGLRDKFLRLFCHRRGQPARCSGLDRPADLAVVSVEHRLQGIGTVAQEMPYVDGPLLAR
jgi:hypothetical protein